MAMAGMKRTGRNGRTERRQSRKEMKTMKKAMSILMAVLMMVMATCAMAEESKTVGVIQYATHPSLDNCYEGFVLGLKEGGFTEGENLTIDFQNAMGDMSNGDMQAKNMVARTEDMLVGVATPAAMSAYAATKDVGTPVIFVAVSDAVAAGIVQSNEEPGGNCTGVSDILNLKAQVEMIRAFLPEATKIGIIYTTSEPNSVSHLEKLESIVPEYGFEVVAVGISGPSEVAAAATSLVAQGVDCINNFTDNNVVDNLSMVLHAADEAGIPVFGSEVEQVVNGCLATEGIDYVALGREAGLMAAAILKGEAEPASMPVKLVDETTPAYNSEVAARLNLTLPEGYEDASDVCAK